MKNSVRGALTSSPTVNDTKSSAQHNLFALTLASVGVVYGDIVLLLGAWQALGNSFGVLFVPFTTTIGRLWDMLRSGPLLPGLMVSGKLYAVTLAINIVVGISVGLLLARSKLVAAAFEPYIYVLYATPTISLVPFVSVMFGFEFGSRVLVAVLISIFPILIGITSNQSGRAS